MPTYAVTGATGRLGRLVIEQLLDSGVPAAEIAAIVRSPEKAADLAARGVEIRKATYDDPSTLPGAVAGVRRLLLVSGDTPGQRVAQHTAVIDAAKLAGVERLVYTSILKADTTANPLAPEHKATEEVLAASGLTYTVLRNSWYTENYTDQLPQYLGSGTILGATGGSKISAATRADYAGAAVAALTRDEDGNAVYELGGTAFTFDELAEAVTEVTGTTVVHQDMSAAELASALENVGLDAGTAGFVAALDHSIANRRAGDRQRRPQPVDRPAEHPAARRHPGRAGLTRATPVPAAARRRHPRTNSSRRWRRHGRRIGRAPTAAIRLSPPRDEQQAGQQAAQGPLDEVRPGCRPGGLTERRDQVRVRREVDAGEAERRPAAARGGRRGSPTPVIMAMASNLAVHRAAHGFQDPEAVVEPGQASPGRCRWPGGTRRAATGGRRNSANCRRPSSTIVSNQSPSTCGYGRSSPTTRSVIRSSRSSRDDR